MCKLFSKYEKQIEDYCNNNGLDFEIAKKCLNVGEKTIYGYNIMTLKKAKMD